MRVPVRRDKKQKRRSEVREGVVVLLPLTLKRFQPAGRSAVVVKMATQLIVPESEEGVH